MENPNCPENVRVCGSTPASNRAQNAVIDARQSRVRDSEMSSCDAQIEMCRDVALQWNLVVTQVFSDEGGSSETLDRPVLQELITAIEAKQIDYLVVYRIDRLTRHLAHL